MNEAQLRYSTARGYFQNVRMIIRSSDYKDEYVISSVMSLHMLAAFALELYYKAWLLGSGVPSNKAWGHDLKKLHADATAAGLPTIHNLEVLKDHFAGPHGDFTYRYIKPGSSINNTNWFEADKVIHALDIEVDKLVGASASQGLQPGH